MTIKEYIYSIDEWQLSSIDSLFTYYRAILDFENRKISLSTYITFVEEYLGTKTNICRSCASSIKKFHSDFQQVIFTQLYKSYNPVFIQIDVEKLKGVKNFGKNGLTLVTASFENINIVLNGFTNDYKRKTYNLSLEEYKEVYAYVQSIIAIKKNFFGSEYYKEYKDVLGVGVDILSSSTNKNDMLSNTSTPSASTKSNDVDALVTSSTSTETTNLAETKPKSKKSKKNNNSTNNN